VTRGRGHVVRRHNSVLRRTTVEILGSRCRLTVGPGARLWDCSITLVGEGAELFIGADCRLRHVRLSVEDLGSRLVIGGKTSITGATLVSQEGRRLQLGKDCMVAQHAELRNSDSHAIYNRDGARINPPRDVVVGNHVWIGLGACLFKGARIGDGAVIGARALVTGEIPPACLAYGAPATPRRNEIRWSRCRVAEGLPPELNPLAPSAARGSSR
jgi:acetyltransferase-like isoleucine patch superfamily enzyme